MTTFNPLAGAWAAAALMLALVSPAQAQAQAPAKAQQPRPAAKPAVPAAQNAEAKTLSFSAGSGKGPILTKDELRVCLQQEDSLRSRLDQHEALRAPLTAEKDAIASEVAALRTERGAMDEIKKQFDELADRSKAHSARVSALDQRVVEFNAKPGTGAPADRLRVELNKEREALQKAYNELVAEQARLTAASKVVVDAYNAKAGPADQRAADWNQRNQAWNDGIRALEAERQGWLASCADRRYREDDEIAIKRGR